MCLLPICIFFCEVSGQIFRPFKNWEWSYDWGGGILYTVWLLSDTCHRYFLPGCGLSIFLIVIFWWAKEFIFNKVQFIRFFFSGSWLHALPAPRSWRYFSKLSFSSFMVLAFMFKFMIHFKLVSIMVWGRDWGSLFHIDIQLFQKHLLYFPFPKFLLCLVKNHHLTLCI